MIILINRSDAIGDTLLTLPLANKLKKLVRPCHIIFIISPSSRDLFKEHPDVDEVWVLDPKKKTWIKNLVFLWKKFQTLWTQRKKIDLYLHVGGSRIPSLMAFLWRVRQRGGVLVKGSDFLFLNKGLRQKRSQVERHEAEYNLDLLRSVDGPWSSSLEDCNANAQELRYLWELKLHLLPAEREEGRLAIEKIFQENHLPPEKEFIILHPGMKGHTLNWPSEKYLELVQAIEHHYSGRFHFVVSYTPIDEPYLKPFRELLYQDQEKNLSFQKKVIFFDGSLKGLRHYMKILANAALFIGPSTGTTHMANALGVKLVGIYSPIKVQTAQRWGPYRQDHSTVIIAPSVHCEENFQCAKQKCLHYNCMANSDIGRVLEQVKSLLDKKEDGEKGKKQNESFT